MAKNKKNNKKNNKRRLLLLILLLVLTITLIGGATYAWFTANTKVSIEAMQLEVSVANGIEISSDAKNWSTKLNLNDLYEASGVEAYGTARSEDAGSVNQLPRALKNVSTIGNIRQAESVSGAKDTNRLDLYYGVATTLCHPKQEGNNKPDTTKWAGLANKEYPGGIKEEECLNDNEDTLGLVKTETYKEGQRACADAAGVDCESSIGVVAFDIYLKLDEASTVSLAPGSYVKNLTKTDYGLKNTIRVAFVTLGTQPKDYYEMDDKNKINGNGQVDFTKLSPAQQEKPENKAYAKTPADNGFDAYAGVYGARKMNGFGSISIWEPNAQQHTANGLKNAEEYGKVISGADVTDGLYQNIAEADLPMPYAKTNTTGSDAATAEKYFAPQRHVYVDEVTPGGTIPYKNGVNYKQFSDSTSESFKLYSAPAGVTKVRVYIWVEGNDVDTENNATSSSIEAMLSFTTASTSTADVNEADYEKYVRTGTENVWRTGANRAATLPSVTGTASGSTTPTA